ncbi:MAG: aldehyde ferredoxin oxidoreductase family protein [bacterium]|nr:MAG: aldehyde ferredoxin oxidoreductase family protein [bacterium]
MREIIGTSNKVLEINLTTREVIEFKIIEDERRQYIGGKGLGLKLLIERLKPGIDPLGEENILVFMMGVLMGTGAPCSGRFAAVTKSPLTGIMVSATCGGPFGMAYKTAGYDGLLIRGKTNKSIYLVIDANDIKFEDASHLWGKDTVETQQVLNLSKNEGALVIGPAGENKVLYANIASGHRYLGRGGFGAVMGAKNLKAIVARGKEYKIIPENKEKFDQLKKRAIKYINNNSFTVNQYRRYGTASHFKYCNKSGTLSVINFTEGSHQRALEISGEAMIEKYHSEPSSCISCSIICGHKGRNKDGTVHQIPEYQTAALFGANLGIFDSDMIIQWNDLCGRLGMDTISTATTLAYVIEANQKGLIKTELRFGSAEGIDETLVDIAHRRGQGDELANGTRWLSQKYGGKQFAMQVKGMELSCYDPRGAWGQGLAYATANRGGHHLSAFLVGQEVIFNLLNPYTTRAKVEFVHFFESLFSMINSLVSCLFVSYGYLLEAPIAKYTPNAVLKFVMQNMPNLAIRLMNVSMFSKFFETITGIKMSRQKMMEAGHRIHTLERYMNTREGISRKDDTLPDRFLKEGRKNDPENRTVPLEKMLEEYYKIRGYDENGIPTVKTLAKFEIEIKL